MKNIAIFLLIVLSVSSFSCDFLEEEPKGLISDTYAKTEEGVESLILSIYQRNRYLTERLYKFADCGTDLTTYATNGVGWPYEEAMIYNDPLMISNRWNSQYWKYLYKGLNVANLGVQYIQETPIACFLLVYDCRDIWSCIPLCGYSVPISDNRRISTGYCCLLQENIGRFGYCFPIFGYASEYSMGPYEYRGC